MQVQRAPVSGYAANARQGLPRISSSRDSKLVCHDEFIQNIAGSVAFAVTQLSVNPGLAATFPWLSLESVGWERYRFRKLQFYTTTQCATTATGAMIIAPDYDSGDAAPGSEQILMDYKDRVDGPPWKIDPLVCTLNPESMTLSYKSHFVRNSSIPANEDIQTYDVANINLGTVGQAGTTNITKLHARYECEFFEPQLPPLGNPFQATDSIVGTAGLAGAAQFGTSQTIFNVGSLITSAASNTLTFSGLAVGASYMFTQFEVGTVLAFANPTITGGTINSGGGVVDAGTTHMISIIGFIATATSGTILLNSTATTVTVAQYSLVPYPGTKAALGLT